MKEATVKGKIAFINHEKKYAIVEYEQNGKKKTVTANIDLKIQKQQKEQNLIKKTHHYLQGDVVEFKPKISDRGDRMIAANMQFLYNDALDVLVNKSKSNNRFLGYLKKADDKYFVKEIESYLFFPVPLSPWQLEPTEDELNEQVTFALENTDKKEKIFAVLSDNKYIPEFQEALKLHRSKTPVDAEVYNITSHGIYLNIIGEKIRAKLPVDNDENKIKAAAIKPGDKFKVLISHLSKSKIAVEPV